MIDKKTHEEATSTTVADAERLGASDTGTGLAEVVRFPAARAKKVGMIVDMCILGTGMRDWI
jgi:hypothetical protein